VLYINEDLLQGNTVQKLELNCNRQWGTYDKENLASLKPEKPPFLGVSVLQFCAHQA